MKKIDTQEIRQGFKNIWTVGLKWEYLNQIDSLCDLVESLQEQINNLKCQKEINNDRI